VAEPRNIPLHRVLGDVPGVRWLVAGIGAAVVGCAVLARIIAPSDFPSIGRALWWSVQTVTTVGYGDVVPTSDAGRSIAAVLMIVGVAFVTLVTASISAAFVGRVQRRRGTFDPHLLEAIDRVEQRLAAIEAELARRG
jgi:voltage-gated potassium channel